MLLLLKAQIKGGAVHDLFAAPVHVEGHIKGGHYVAPYTAVRHKAPDRPPMDHAGIAREVLAHHAAWRKGYGKNPPMTSPAGWLHSWATDNKRKLSDADETAVLDHLFRILREDAAKPSAPEVHAHPPAAAPHAPAETGAQGGFPTIYAAAEELKRRGFTAPTNTAVRWTHPDGRVMLLGGSLKGKTGQSAGSGARWQFGFRPEESADAKPGPQPLPHEPEPAHLAEGRKRLEHYRSRRSLTAMEEHSMKLWEKRLAANPAKWGVGQGVSYQVHGGRGMQTNRGFRIVEIDAAGKRAIIRSVADTGLTTSGGSHDQIDDAWVYLGELKRDVRYDAPVPKPMLRRTESEDDVIRRLARLDAQKIGAYDPDKAVRKLRRQWIYQTVEGSDATFHPTRKEAVAAAERHIALKREQLAAPRRYFNVVGLIARAQLDRAKQIEKRSFVRIPEMALWKQVREEIPDWTPPS